MTYAHEECSGAEFVREGKSRFGALLALAKPLRLYVVERGSMYSLQHKRRQVFRGTWDETMAYLRGDRK
jgi:hypothetical protein